MKKLNLNSETAVEMVTPSGFKTQNKRAGLEISFSVSDFTTFWNLKQESFSTCVKCGEGINKDDVYLNRSMCQCCRQLKDEIVETVTASRQINGKPIALKFCGCGRVHSADVFCNGSTSRLSAFDRLNQFGLFVGGFNG